ncbi:hypothetical protein H4Q26_001956 [Puccinia striiformis f. sp. tritici PST-130]|nr:hypothetical protein H4Q26_001956 [Puccinia striiformis f. sp. tritici PST-130]
MQSSMFFSALSMVIIDQVQPASVDVMTSFKCPSANFDRPLCVYTGNLDETFHRVGVQEATRSPLKDELLICADVDLGFPDHKLDMF